METTKLEIARKYFTKALRTTYICSVNNAKRAERRKAILNCQTVLNFQDCEYSCPPESSEQMQSCLDIAQLGRFVPRRQNQIQHGSTIVIGCPASHLVGRRFCVVNSGRRRFVVLDSF
jgi:hypothetical protein